jgi:hypothetical protein
MGASSNLFLEMREEEINEIEVVDYETILSMQGQSILIFDQL